MVNKGVVVALNTAMIGDVEIDLQGEDMAMLLYLWGVRWILGMGRSTRVLVLDASVHSTH